MAEEIQQHILRKFQIIQRIGKGAYGIVWQAIDRKLRQVVALKKVFDAFHNATDAQRTFRQTDLHAVIRAGILQDIHKKFVIYQVLKALKFIHSGDLIHRDLKPSNILLNSECHVKLADFGLARSVASHETDGTAPVLTEYVATRWYRAPEILLGSTKYTKAVDMWSVGCILGELIVGKAIFPGTSTLNQIQRVLELTGKPKPEDVQSIESGLAQNILANITTTQQQTFQSFFQGASEDALDLIKKLLCFNPNLRLTADQALKHKYVQDFHTPQEELECDHIIEITMDDNKKFSIRQYREALYSDISKRKKEQRRQWQAQYLSQLGVNTSQSGDSEVINKSDIVGGPSVSVGSGVKGEAPSQKYEEEKSNPVKSNQAPTTSSTNSNNNNLLNNKMTDAQRIQKASTTNPTQKENTVTSSVGKDNQVSTSNNMNQGPNNPAPSSYQNYIAPQNSSSTSTTAPNVPYNGKTYASYTNGMGGSNVSNGYVSSYQGTTGGATVGGSGTNNGSGGGGLMYNAYSSYAYQQNKNTSGVVNSSMNNTQYQTNPYTGTSNVVNNSSNNGGGSNNFNSNNTNSNNLNNSSTGVNNSVSAPKQK